MLEFRSASTLESTLTFIKLERAISYFTGKSCVYFTYKPGVPVQTVIQVCNFRDQYRETLQ